MKHLFIAIFTLFCFAGSSLFASAAEKQANEYQKMSTVFSAVEAFIYRETRELSGEVIVKLGKVDNRITLPTCLDLVPFTPTGGRLWGNTSVGVRCDGEVSWTIYIQLNIAVLADVVHSARPLVRGKSLVTDDIILRKVNLTQMPAGILTELSQVIGKVPTSTLSSGQPLRQHALRAPHVILRGQNVKLQVQGHGFSVSSEGHALADASEGKIVQVRNKNGRVISGTARVDAIVEVQP